MYRTYYFLYYLISFYFLQQGFLFLDFALLSLDTKALLVYYISLARWSVRGHVRLMTKIKEDKEETQEATPVTLTKRELEVLSLVLEGKSSREVSAALYCSKRTVDFHLSRIYEKLQVSNRVQAMRRATLLGLL